MRSGGSKPASEWSIQYWPSTPCSGPRNPLTTRETEILTLVATGVNVTVIARELYLTAGTVRNHISSVMTKLGARNRLDAVRIGTQQGWL